MKTSAEIVRSWCRNVLCMSITPNTQRPLIAEIDALVEVKVREERRRCAELAQMHLDAEHDHPQAVPCGKCIADQILAIGDPELL